MVTDLVVVLEKKNTCVILVNFAAACQNSISKWNTINIEDTTMCRKIKGNMKCIEERVLKQWNIMPS